MDKPAPPITLIFSLNGSVIVWSRYDLNPCRETCSVGGSRAQGQLASFGPVCCQPPRAKCPLAGRHNYINITASARAVSMEMRAGRCKASSKESQHWLLVR